MNLEQLTDIIAIELKDPNNNTLKEVIRNLIISSRSKLIRDEFHKTREFPQAAVIPVNCIPMVEVPSTECCSVNLGCTVLRTSYKIPRPIEVKDTTNFNYVGSINHLSSKATEFGYIKPEQISRLKYRKFTSGKIYYTWLADYIYVFNAPALEDITIRYVPVNFLDVMALKTCALIACVEDSDFIIEAHWEDLITKMILPKLANTPTSEIKVNDEETIQI